MKKLLLLFDQATIDNRFADPERLISRMQKSAGKTAVIDYEVLENLLFYVSQDEAVITGGKKRKILDSYDAVYFRRMDNTRPLSLTTAIYLKKKSVPFIDEEAYMPVGSFTKLSQLFRLWEHDLPIPKTIYGISKPEQLWFFYEHLGSFPVVVKATLGTRGSDNYLVNNEKELIDILATNPDLRFLIQEYIPNQEDFRVLVAGSEIKMLIKRTRGKTDSHKNNVSLGAHAERVPLSSLSDVMLEDSVRAAHVLGRNFAGVDIVISKNDGKHYFFEVNRAPQIESSSYEDDKAQILFNYLKTAERVTKINKSKAQKRVHTIGRAETIDFPELKLQDIPARIDTGAKTSTVWASNIKEKDNELSFTLFDKTSKHYTGHPIKAGLYSRRMVSSSNGIAQARYVVKLLMRLNGRKIRASFTLSDRSAQVYPVLVGRNILRGKFIVDVKQGKPLTEEEKARTRALELELKKQKGRS